MRVWCLFNYFTRWGRALSRTLIPLLVLATLVGEAPIAGVVGQESELFHSAIVECAIVAGRIIEGVGAIYGTLSARWECPISLVHLIGPLADFSAQLFMCGGKIGAEGEYNSVPNYCHSASLTCFYHELVLPLRHVPFAIERAMRFRSATSSGVSGPRCGGGSINRTL